MYNVAKGKLDIQVYNSSLLTEVVGIQLHTIYIKLSLDKNSPSPATCIAENLVEKILANAVRPL